MSEIMDTKTAADHSMQPVCDTYLPWRQTGSLSSSDYISGLLVMEKYNQGNCEST